VRLELKLLLLLLPLLTLGVTGCGGIQASHSVSPASIFLPGLLKNEPVDSAIPSLARNDTHLSGFDRELTRHLTQSN
jgi:hypothetical protein